ncbi:MAG: SPOR domain-containing protein [Deferribacteres bacterium]|nr:SPOR domain-containing protein [Deferribacteres bacterium]
MVRREPKIYTFSFKRKEIVAVLAGLIITYIMVFLLGVEIGKDLFSEPAVVANKEEVVRESEGITEENREERIQEPVVIARKSEENFNQEEKSEEEKEVATPIKPVVKPEKREVIPTSRIFIQAGAFAKKSYALDLLKRLKERGYRAQIREIGKLYKVILGPYPSEKTAKEDLVKLRRDEKIYGYIIHL